MYCTLYCTVLYSYKGSKTEGERQRAIARPFCRRLELVLPLDQEFLPLAS